jgi:iron(III) transport system permease protein
VSTVADGAERRPSPGLIDRPRRIDWRRLLSIQTLVVGLTVLVVAYLALVPIIYLLWGTFFDESGFTLENLINTYAADGLAPLLGVSTVFAFGATVVSLVTGTFLAFLTERTDIGFKKLIFVSALVPLVIPGILYTISWIFLASPRIGLYNKVLEPLLGPGFIDIFTVGGMIIVEGLSETPVAFLLMVAAFRSMDPSLEESAMTSGIPLRAIFWRITMPLARPALFGAFLLLIVKNFQSFETPALLGLPSGIWMFTSKIWLALNQLPADYGGAGALSLSLLAITSVGMWIYYRSTRGGKRFQTITGKGFRPRTLRLGRWRGVLTAAMLLYFMVAIAIPVLILLYMSTQPFYSVPSIQSLSNMTIDNYVYIFEFPQVATSFQNSFILSIGAGFIVMLLAAVVSWITIRTKLPGRWALDNLMLLPLVMPGLVVGVALLFVYLRSPIAIYGTLWILLIAYVTTKLPYGARYASVSMHQIGQELEESAQTSGANWSEVFRNVYLPLLFPGLLVGFLYVVLTSMRELGSSLLLYSPGNEVVSTMIWEMYQNGQFTQLAALGIVLIAVLVTIVVVAQRLGRRFGIQAQ